MEEGGSGTLRSRDKWLVLAPVANGMLAYKPQGMLAAIFYCGLVNLGNKKPIFNCIFQAEVPKGLKALP